MPCDRGARTGPPLLRSEGGPPDVCVGEKGVEDKLQGLNTCIASQDTPFPFDVCGDFFPHFLPGWHVLISDFCFVNNPKG